MPYKYFDDTWKTKIFRCRACGWSGTCDQAQVGYYQDFLDIMCPRCDVLSPRTLALVMHPTVAEMRAHADRPEIRRQLERNGLLKESGMS